MKIAPPWPTSPTHSPSTPGSTPAFCLRLSLVFAAFRPHFSPTSFSTEEVFAPTGFCTRKFSHQEAFTPRCFLTKGLVQQRTYMFLHQHDPTSLYTQHLFAPKRLYLYTNKFYKCSPKKCVSKDLHQNVFASTVFAWPAAIKPLGQRHAQFRDTVNI